MEVAVGDGELKESRGGEGGSADAGSSALASVSPASEHAPDAPPALTAELPGEPLKDQMTPPCEPRQVEIKGGCWVPAFVSAPCPRNAYEWKDSCYFPILLSKRGPTSEEK